MASTYSEPFSCFKATKLTLPTRGFTRTRRHSTFECGLFAFEYENIMKIRVAFICLYSQSLPSGTNLPPPAEMKTSN